MTKSNKTKFFLTAITAANGLATFGPHGKLTNEQIARAWESSEYRQSLTAEQLKQLPANPAGDLVFQSGDENKSRFIAATITDSCATITDDCATITDTCATITNTCATITDTCSTQFGSCEMV